MEMLLMLSLKPVWMAASLVSSHLRLHVSKNKKKADTSVQFKPTTNSPSTVCIGIFFKTHFLSSERQVQHLLPPPVCKSWVESVFDENMWLQFILHLFSLMRLMREAFILVVSLWWLLAFSVKSRLMIKTWYFIWQVIWTDRYAALGVHPSSDSRRPASLILTGEVTRNQTEPQCRTLLWVVRL